MPPDDCCISNLKESCWLFYGITCRDLMASFTIAKPFFRSITRKMAFFSWWPFLLTTLHFRMRYLLILFFALWCIYDTVPWMDYFYRMGHFQGAKIFLVWNSVSFWNGSVSNDSIKYSAIRLYEVGNVSVYKSPWSNFETFQQRLLFCLNIYKSVIEHAFL